MPEVEKILKLVADGVLTPEEADEILSALNAPARTGKPEPRPEPTRPATAPGQARHLRIEVLESGRRVVNLRVPINIAGWASAYLPGLSEQDSERIRAAIASGVRGPIIDIGDDGDRVLITSE